MGKTRLGCRALFLLASIGWLGMSGFTQESAPAQLKMSRAEQKAVIDRIGPLLCENYVFPEAAVKMEAALKAEYRRGAFASALDPQAFASRATAILQSVFQDRHLRVAFRPPRPDQPRDENPLLALEQAQLRSRQQNFSFPTVQVLDGNVGYLEFRGFHPAPVIADKVAAVMKFLEDTDAIIIDMRRNGGGSPSGVQLVCSYFFDRKVHLNSLYWRRSDSIQEFWTLDNVAGKRMPDVPLYVLTSRQTFSGGEEFCYNLLNLKRATLVGEVTGGGANPGGSFPVGGRFAVFIPTGRAINPVSKTNWEGTGVKPHVETEAGKAFDVAYEAAKKAAAESSQKKLAALTARVNGFSAGLEAVLERHGREKSGESAAGVNEALRRGIDGGLLDENRINQLGYSLQGKNQSDEAIAVFTFNTRAFPESANAYDSLGEAWLKKGDRLQALENYRKSLQLDPKNENARKAIAKLEEAGKKKNGP